MKYRIGVDVGGANIKAVLVDSKTKVRKRVKLDTAKNKPAILNQIACSINSLLESVNKRDVGKIGIGVPGIVNRKTRRIVKLPNIPYLNNFPLKQFIERKFYIKTVVENDALCAALGEYHFFRKKPESLLVVTLGTGVGGGIVLNGKPLERTEPGHLTINMYGLKDSCGNRGCLEQYVGKKFLEREARKRNLPKDIKKLAQLARKNKKASSLFQEMGKYLGIGIADMVKIIDPQIIIISGGLANVAYLFLPSAIKELKARTFFKPKSRIIISKNENVGAIGATLL